MPGDQMSTSLSLYWGLASLESKERIESADKLMESLLNEKKLDSKGLISSETDLEEKCSIDLSYSIKRLIKGLASSRKAARRGFSLALTQVCSKYKVLSINLF